MIVGGELEQVDHELQGVIQALVDGVDGLVVDEEAGAERSGALQCGR